MKGDRGRVDVGGFVAVWTPLVNAVAPAGAGAHSDHLPR